VIAGTPQEGQTLIASASGGQGDNITYQWMENSGAGGAFQNIAGATGSTYLVKEADEGFNIEVVATATNSNGGAASATSAATAAGPDARRAGTAPLSPGTAQEGQQAATAARPGQDGNH